VTPSAEADVDGPAAGWHDDPQSIDVGRKGIQRTDGSAVIPGPRRPRADVTLVHHDDRHGRGAYGDFDEVASQSRRQFQGTGNGCGGELSRANDCILLIE